MTRIVVTSVSGAHGDRYGALVCFSRKGSWPGRSATAESLIRGLSLSVSLSPAGDLAYVNSGDERGLAFDANRKIAADSGRTGGLDPAGRNIRAGRPLLALPPGLDTEGEPFLPDGVVRFPRGTRSKAIIQRVVGRPSYAT